eukprot:8748244-Pyramimonas_sp.AAC.1
MYLLHWNAKHIKVATETSWDQLMSKASQTILDLAVTEHVRQRFNVEVDAFVGMHPAPKSWVELAVWQVVGDQNLVEDMLGEALLFHRAVSDQAAGHLSLIADNTYRTPWLAAKMLSTDTGVARSAATALARHQASTRPMNRTTFEAHLFDARGLWANMAAFSEADPPVLLWRGQGKFEQLFKFLAPRFFLAPGRALDAERVHARWQWACTIKRGLKMYSLNACLRLTHYLENNQQFPSNEDLFSHLQAEQRQHRVDMRATVQEGEIALGWRSEFLYRERLG